LPKILGIKIVHPSTAVSEPEEVDRIDAAVAVCVLHDSRLGEGHDLTGFDTLARAIAREGSGDTNTAIRASGVEVGEALMGEREGQMGGMTRLEVR